MNQLKYFFIALFIMAGITYLVRMLPFVLFRKKIKNNFLKSFFYYIPYAVLAAMTIPAIFYSTSDTVSAWAGFIVAVVLSYLEKSLLKVAIFSCSAVLLCELILK